MNKRHIALGFFDGVHLGHGALLSRVRDTAAESGGIPCVITFEPHPEKLLIGTAPPLLNTISERTELMRRLYGIEEVILLPFDERMMRMPWGLFFEEILMKDFNPAMIAVGKDFHFGYRGEGNCDRLAEACASVPVRCDIIPNVIFDGITVSSTYIRGLVAQGDVEHAARFLGHNHAISGVVKHGRKLGSSIGFPTANIALPNGVLCPRRGVYVSQVFFDGISRSAITNIGVRPTVSSGEVVSIETSIFDFTGNLYNKQLNIELLKFLRPEETFVNVEALKTQIEKDVSAAKIYLDKRGATC